MSNLKLYTTEELQKAFMGNSKSQAKQQGLATYNPHYNPKILRRIDKQGFIKNKELIDKEMYWHRDCELMLSAYPINCSDRFHYELYISKITKEDLFRTNYNPNYKLSKKEEKQLEEANKTKKESMKAVFHFLWDKFASSERHPENNESAHGIWLFNIPNEVYDNILHINILSTHRLDSLERIISQKAHQLKLQ